MAKEYKIPGVYIEEISKLLPLITSVETAIPAFIGYTEKAQFEAPEDLHNVPKRINSLLEYDQYYGLAQEESGSLKIVFDNSSGTLKVYGKVDEAKRSKFLMYYSLRIYFENGGGPCWIVSVGNYADTGGDISDTDLKKGLTEAANVDEVTLLLFPDALNIIQPTLYYSLIAAALSQCFELKDRFTIFDIYRIAENVNDWEEDIRFFRESFPASAESLKYGAVYFPGIYTALDFLSNEETVGIVSDSAGVTSTSLTGLKDSNNAYYFLAKNALNNIEMLLPASPAIAGIYATVDNTLGVWKSPANVNIRAATRPEIQINDAQQQRLNVDEQGGKSVNVIRKFTGRGSAMVWGARTLAGNDNEWRYIPVRRFFIMVEESVKKGTEQFVFEANDVNTWVRVRSVIENYLNQQWRSGALQGTTSQTAFFVHVGLGETMTQQDLLEGKMIVEIGMAVVRPAEFIILRFMYKMSGGPDD